MRAGLLLALARSAARRVRRGRRRTTSPTTHDATSAATMRVRRGAGAARAPQLERADRAARPGQELVARRSRRAAATSPSTLDPSSRPKRRTRSSSSPARATSTTRSSTGSSPASSSRAATRRRPGRAGRGTRRSTSRPRGPLHEGHGRDGEVAAPSPRGRPGASSSSSPPTASILPADYAIVGEVSEGIDVVERIGELGERDRRRRRSRSSSARHRLRELMTLAAVVLAAGEATRFGAPKQRLLLPPVLDRLAADARRRDRRRRRARTSSTAPERQVSALVRCAEWARGPGASLRCGLAALGPESKRRSSCSPTAPISRPSPSTASSTTWRTGGGIVAASYEGARGHPLVLGRDDWDDVPDGGLHERPARLVPCDDLGAARRRRHVPRISRRPEARRSRRGRGALRAWPSGPEASARRRSSSRTGGASPRSGTAAGSSRSPRGAPPPPAHSSFVSVRSRKSWRSSSQRAQGSPLT